MPFEGWALWMLQILAFVAKVGFFLFLFVWVRWTLPRFRYDQLMNLGWKRLFPLALANIFVTGAARGLRRDPEVGGRRWNLPRSSILAVAGAGLGRAWWSGTATRSSAPWPWPSTWSSIAGFYLLLNAQFLALLQVIVYAGAIMVLILFVIMLLNLPEEAPARRVGHDPGRAGLRCSAVAFAVIARPGADRRRRRAGGFARAVAGLRHGRRRSAWSCSASSSTPSRRSRCCWSWPWSARCCWPRGGSEMEPATPPDPLRRAVRLGVFGVLCEPRRDHDPDVRRADAQRRRTWRSSPSRGMFDQAEGQIYVFFIMTLAAAEAAVGLAIVIALFRLRESTDVDELNLMKW